VRLTAPRDAILTALRLVGPAVAPRTTKPVLACVLATADAGGLTLTASDLEVTIRHRLPGVAVARPGSAVLPHARLTAVLGEADAGDVTLDADADGIAVRTPAGRFKLPAADPAEFPDMPEEGDPHHEIDAGLLKALIRRTAFAADQKEGTARFAVTGLLWEAVPGKLTLVGTDTKRLAVAHTGDLTVTGETPKSHPLVPRKAVHLLDRCLADDGGTVRVGLGGGMAFGCGPTTLHTRLVEGRFPPYSQILPKAYKVAVALPTLPFLSAVRQAAVMADAESKRVDFAFAAAGLTLAARGADVGQGEVAFPLPGYAGPDLAIAFDPQYLTEFLKLVDAEAVVLEMTDGARPAVFRVGDDFRYLVMPLAGE
jgi:DNA polymerase-3 subunit beta